MTDYHTKASGSDSNIQTDSYIIMKTTTTSLHHRQQKIHKKDHRSLHIATPTLSFNKKNIFILGDSMVKYTTGWNISRKLDSKQKVYVCSFSSAKVKSMKDYSNPCFKEDESDHLILNVGNNDLTSKNITERFAKYTVDLGKGLVADDRTISVSSTAPRNDKLNSKAAEVNSYL